MMKLLSCFLLLFIMKMYHGKRISLPQDGIRVPLTKIRVMSENLDSAITDESKIPLYYLRSTFSGNVTIGTDQVRLQFDTGSSVLWVFSNDYKQLNGNHKTYNHKTSKTYVHHKNSISGEQKYLKSWVRGNWSIDDVSIAEGISKQMKFIEVTKADNTQINKGYDGIMGLRDTVENFGNNFIKKLCGEKNSIFSFHLPSFSNIRASGSLTLCGQNQNYIKELHYVEDIGEGIWQIEMNRVRLLKRQIKTPALAVVDTGSSAIFGPQKTIFKFYEKLKIPLNENRDYPEIDCSNLKKDLILQFEIKEINHTLSGDDYILKLTTNKGEKCFVFLLPLPPGKKGWILGEPFLRKFYTVFDMDRRQIGFAENNE